MNRSVIKFARFGCGHLAVGLLCWLLLLPAAAADTVANPLPQESSAEQDDQADDDELDGADDGSRALDDRGRRVGEHVLLPVTNDEEQRLLGDWGDSENED